MKTLVEILRDQARIQDVLYLEDAADEIERLRSEVKSLERLRGTPTYFYAAEAAELRAENERLKAGLNAHREFCGAYTSAAIAWLKENYPHVWAKALVAADLKEDSGDEQIRAHGLNPKAWP